MVYDKLRSLCCGLNKEKCWSECMNQSGDQVTIKMGKRLLNAYVGWRQGEGYAIKTDKFGEENYDKKKDSERCI